VPPDACTALGRILVSSPRHCSSHGWTALVRVERDGRHAYGPTSPRLCWIDLLETHSDPNGSDGPPLSRALIGGAPSR
jgi:hypothetical protein